MDDTTVLTAHKPARLPQFLSDFADFAEWARMYRALELQVVPSYLPGEVNGGASWKRPALAWRAFQDDLVPDQTFARWYGLGGEHASRQNMGVITGRASGNLMVLDLDVHKTPAAAHWWESLLQTYNAGLSPETPTQVTGGGGRQLLFRCPPGWGVPTCKTAIGVDVRGQGGFAVLPPSRHESGRSYRWEDGLAPWEVEIDAAPQWLLDVVDDLVELHGGDTRDHEPGEKTSTPASALDPFANIIDNRETLLRDTAWHAVLELYRVAPIPPPQAEVDVAMDAAYEAYEAKVTTRLPGVEKRVGLEKEGRGPTEFRRKWRSAMRKWGRPEFVREADKPPPEKEPAWAPPPQPAQTDPQTGEPLGLVLTAQQFVDGFTPPSYLIDGVVQRGYLYALTARTGAGKTAVSMYIGQCVAREQPMHGRGVQGGTVLMLAGENPDDIRARYLVLAEAFGFDPGKARIRFIAGVVDIPARMAEIRAAAATIDDLVLVIVDTAAAYFPGDETNSNSQQGAYARVLRQLTFLPGKPAVVVNCHPVKNAARDNLIPMGGSAFLNEVDGNLTLWANNEKQASLHWLGKFRGPEFDPLNFELRVASSDRVKDAKGRLMPSVVAEPISETTLEAGQAVQESDENKVMRLLHDNPEASFAVLAQKAGFMGGDGKPQRTRIQRIVERLKADRMVENWRNHKYRLTKKGQIEIGVEDD